MRPYLRAANVGWGGIQLIRNTRHDPCITRRAMLSGGARCRLTAVPRVALLARIAGLARLSNLPLIAGLSSLARIASCPRRAGLSSRARLTRRSLGCGLRGYRAATQQQC